MNKTSNDDENYNPPTKLGRRNSILKSNDLSKTLSVDDEAFEETTRMRKLRRVSFSSKLHIKEIENNHELKENDLITLANTQANSMRTTNLVMTDISNVNITINSSAVKQQDSKATNLDSSDMGLTDGSSIIHINDSDFLPDDSKNESIMVDTSNIVIESKQTLNDETICSFTSNQTIINKTKILNQTMDIATTNETICAFNNTMNLTQSNDLNESQSNQKKTNETFFNLTLNQTEHINETSLNFSTVNQTKQIDNETAINFSSNQTTMFSNQTNKLNEETVLNFNNNQTTLMFTSLKIQSNDETSLINTPNRTRNNNEETFNQNTNQQFDLNQLKKIEFKSIDQFKQDLFKEVKSSMSDLKDELERMRQRVVKAKEHKQQVNIKREQEKQENVTLKKLNKDLDNKLDELRKELNELKLNADPLYITATSEKCEYLGKRVKEMSMENIKLKQEYEHSIEKLNQIKDKVKVKHQKLEEIKKSKSINEKFLDLCRDVFNEEFINYKIIYMEKETILLSFFYDFIQLEIHATNIANDIQIDFSSDQLFKENKCLNYPILKLFVRSTIDSAISSASLNTPYYATSQDKKSLKKKSRKNVPVFIQYCVDLVLKEIGEGDLLETNKKYKYIRDIPMLINHMSLACKCASSLAKDFEYFSQISTDRKVKCEFDFKNHLVSLILPSLEDACYYKLKLNILPGKYYQEAIPFSIESLDLDDLCQPNIKQISKVVEGQYFEDGSLKTYLTKLKLI